MTGRRGVTATDRLVLGYVALASAAVLWRAGAIPSWPFLLAANALTVLVVALLARQAPTRSVVLLGGAYAIVLSAGFYAQLGVIHTELGLVHDQAIQRWEEAVFGSQVSVTWHERMPNLLLSWVLHACYGSYYLIILSAPLFLYLRRTAADFERGVFCLALGFLASYAVFLFVPVAGPRYFFGVATGPAASVAPARIVHAVLDGGSAWGTAFPSSHVVASWCAVFGLWRPAPRLALAMAPVAAGLALGTVYGQFHYGVDAVAGAGLAALLMLVADPLRRVLAVDARAHPGQTQGLAYPPEPRS